MTTPQIVINEIVFDAPNLEVESRFWAALLGGEVTEREEDWVTVTGPDGRKVGVQLAPDHVPPQWPDGAPQQMHLDLQVTDIAAAHAHAVALGARVLAPSDGPDLSKQRGFVVYADPAGHPFCLCW